MDQNIIDLFHKLADCSAAEREEYYARHHVGADRRAEVEALLRFDKTTNQSVAGHVAFVAREALEEEGATQVMKPEERLSHRSAPAAPDAAQTSADSLAAGATRWVAANAIPIEAVEAGHGFRDLQPFREVIGDARIVALGESTHGTREFFQLKHREELSFSSGR